MNNVCKKCKKEMHNEMIKEADRALKRFTKKLFKKKK